MTDDDKSTDDMNAQEQQNYFNELAEKMMKGEITRETAVSLYHSKYEADTCDYQYILEENQRLKATRLPVYEREKRLEEAEEEVRCMERRWTKSYECVEILTKELEREKKRYGDAVAEFYEKHIVIPIYWGIDEETGKKIYDTDEMRDEFENAMGDFETDGYAECCDCGKELESDGGDGHLDADGRCVCDDCFKGEESGEE